LKSGSSCARADVEGRCVVVILHDAIEGIDLRVSRIISDQGAGIFAVDRERPELSGGDIVYGDPSLEDNVVHFD